MICHGVNIELIDRRYLDAFSVQDLKRMGCKIEGLKFSKNGLFRAYDRREDFRIKYDYVKYVRPLLAKICFQSMRKH